MLEQFENYNMSIALNLNQVCRSLKLFKVSSPSVKFGLDIAEKELLKVPQNV